MEKEELNIDCGVGCKTHYWKFVSGFLLIIVVVFIALWGLARYERHAGEAQVEKLAETLRQMEQEDYAAAMADTYGGKTPQETLQLYITALEKRDFSLAAKYFIGDNKEREAKRWNNVSEEDIIQAIATLREALKTKEDCNEQKTSCAFYNPILVDMKVYPNGVWKIIEI